MIAADALDIQKLGIGFGQSLIFSIAGVLPPVLGQADDLAEAVFSADQQKIENIVGNDKSFGLLFKIDLVSLYIGYRKAGFRGIGRTSRAVYLCTTLDFPLC